jgi:hypothetical protein
MPSRYEIQYLIKNKCKNVFQSFISMLMICRFICLAGDRKDLDEMISALNEDLAAMVVKLRRCVREFMPHCIDYVC